MSSKHKFVSEGTRQLVQLCRRIGFTGVSRRINVGEGSVRRYCTGERCPTVVVRALLLKEFQVPLEVWTQPPVEALPEGFVAEAEAADGKGAAPTPPAARPAARPRRGAGPSAQDSEAKVTAAETLQLCKDMLDKAKRDPLTTAREMQSLVIAIDRSVKTLARFDGSLTFTELHIVRSAPFQRVMAVLRRVLDQHPAVARQLSDELDRVLKNGPPDNHPSQPAH